jgi:multiple sugar transport system permease protein
VSGSFIYLVGTLLLWAGGIATLILVSRVFGLLFNGTSTERQQGASKLLLPAVLSGVGLFLGGLLSTPIGAKGWNIPLAWVVMPLTGWLSLACAIGATFRFVQAFLGLHAEERIRKALAGVVWLLIGAIFLSLFFKDPAKAEVLRGAVPVQPSTVMAFVVLACAAILAMVLAGRSTKSRGHANAIVTQVALLAGSLVFGIPFAYLLVTSFKEDRDMVSANGIIWVPKVQLEVPHLDPKNPMYEGQLEGMTVRGEVIERLPDGRVKVDVIRPIAIRGKTFLTTLDKLKVVPKMAPLVRGTYQGRRVEGKVVDNKENGEQIISIMKPEGLAGTIFTATQSSTEPVREVGLKWSNYSESLEYLPPESEKGLVYLKNTLILVILNVIGTILSSAIVAYAFSRMRFPGKNALFMVMLATMMLPGAVTMLPQFLIFRTLGMVDTLYPLFIRAFFASAFNVFLLRQFFMSIPMELEDAAKIDGSSYLNTFWRVMMPLIKPALVVIGVMTFVGTWNDFSGPLIYINSPENMPIPYAVQLYGTDRAGEPGMVMAFVTMAMLPVLALFFFAQRYFIEGVTLTGLGGR